MNEFSEIRAIAFDADDTLWDNQSHFEAVERRYCEILAPYGDTVYVSRQLFITETANMPLLGYGSKAFTLSLIENALRISNNNIAASSIEEILELGKSLSDLPSTPLPEVERTLASLKDNYRLALFTKGELLNQQNKLHRSGLSAYFCHVEIVSDKTESQYIALCRHLDIEPSELLMVGNSFKSDIIPALSIGAAAIYIPFHTTWQLEHAEEFSHKRLVKVSNFSEIQQIIMHL